MGDIFPVLISMLRDAPFEIQKEALWALSNATTDAKKEMVIPLVQMGLIKAICAFLKKNMCHSHNRSDKMLSVALECVENILIVGSMHLCNGEENKFAQELEECGGLEFLEELQADDENVSDEIYEKVVEMIGKYLDDEEDVPLDYGDFGTMQRNNSSNNNDSNQFSFGTG